MRKEGDPLPRESWRRGGKVDDQRRGEGENRRGRDRAVRQRGCREGEGGSSGDDRNGRCRRGESRREGRSRRREISREGEDSRRSQEVSSLVRLAAEIV